MKPIRPGLASALAAALAGATPAAAAPPLPYTVSAPADATYDLRCRFRKIPVENKLGLKIGKANSIDLSGKGPQRGTLPSDNARCSLRQTGGRGPVVFRVVKDKAYTATVAEPGASAAVFVF